MKKFLTAKNCALSCSVDGGGTASAELIDNSSGKLKFQDKGIFVGNLKFIIKQVQTSDGYSAPNPMPGQINGNSQKVKFSNQAIVLEGAETSVDVPVVHPTAGGKKVSVTVKVQSAGQSKVEAS